MLFLCLKSFISPGHLFSSHQPLSTVKIQRKPLPRQAPENSAALSCPVTAIFPVPRKHRADTQQISVQLLIQLLCCDAQTTKTSFADWLFRGTGKGILVTPTGKERCIPLPLPEASVYSDQSSTALHSTHFPHASPERRIGTPDILPSTCDSSQAGGKTHVLCDEEIQ